MNTISWDESLVVAITMFGLIFTIIFDWPWNGIVIAGTCIADMLILWISIELENYSRKEK